MSRTCGLGRYLVGNASAAERSARPVVASSLTAMLQSAPFRTRLPTLPLSRNRSQTTALRLEFVSSVTGFSWGRVRQLSAAGDYLVPNIRVVGEERVHPGVEEGLDLASQVTDAGRVGPATKVRWQEAVLPAEGPADHLESGIVRVVDHAGGLLQEPGRVPRNHHVL